MAKPMEHDVSGSTRNFRARTALFAVLLGSHVTTLGQEPADAPDPAPNVSAEVPPPGNEIVVQGERIYDEKALKGAVGDIAMRGRLAYRPLARYNSPLCLHVDGLPAATAQAIKSRIEDHARTLGLSLDGKGCKVNALIVSVTEPEAFIDGYRKLRPWAFGLDANQTIRASLRRKDPAIIWFDTVETPADSISLDMNNAPVLRSDVPALGLFGVPFNFVWGSGDTGHTLLRVPVTRSRINGTIVFDANRLGDFTTMQVADYAAMRLFGDTQPTVQFSDDAAFSILSMFETGPATAAHALTLLDRAYLQGIYRMKPYAHAGQLERSAQIAYRELLGTTCKDMSQCEPQATVVEAKR
jgi:hypothetical protein